MKKKENQKTLQ